jgi:hypothetical protein
VDDYCAARSELIPPLPWPTFSPPFSPIPVLQDVARNHTSGGNDVRATKRCGFGGTGSFPVASASVGIRNCGRSNKFNDLRPRDGSTAVAFPPPTTPVSVPVFRIPANFLRISGGYRGVMGSETRPFPQMHLIFPARLCGAAGPLGLARFSQIQGNIRVVWFFEVRLG